MELGGGDSEFKFGKTVVLAYPDATRLAGYRAALGLWKQLSTESKQTCSTYFDCNDAEQVVNAQSEPEIDSFDINSSGVSIVFGTPAALSEVTFCFINGLPAPEHIPALADRVLGLLESHGKVQRLVVPAAANVSGMPDPDRLWLRTTASQLAVAGAHKTPDGAQTNDVFLSALDAMGSVSGINEIALLVHGDKRPSGSGYRQTVTFGKEYVDGTDKAVVDALLGALASAAGVAGTATQMLPLAVVDATRTRLDIDAAAKALPAFG
ncbi:hypothetical protein GGI20_000928 [Coemansia sp. BCRC 34301]|nr:hypothetical protein GGI20_000928 [Coemansia sp. BCRC 34301]